jgi:hypothetical protein
MLGLLRVVGLRVLVPSCLMPTARLPWALPALLLQRLLGRSACSPSSSDLRYPWWLSLGQPNVGVVAVDSDHVPIAARMASRLPADASLCASVWGLVSPRPAKASLRPQGRGLPCTGGLAPTEGPPRRIVMGGKRCCPVRASKPRSTTVRFSRSLVGASLTSSGAGVSIACPGHTVWRHAATHAGAYAAMVWATWPVPVSVRDRFLLQWSATGAVSAVVWAPRLVVDFSHLPTSVWWSRVGLCMCRLPVRLLAKAVGVDARGAKDSHRKAPTPPPPTLQPTSLCQPAGRAFLGLTR